MEISKKPDYNQYEFRKDITEVINKYFIGDTQLSVNEVLELFELGYQTKYKKLLDNYKEFQKEKENLEVIFNNK